MKHFVFFFYLDDIFFFFTRQASTYQESVLRPRQEAQLQKKEQRFYRMTGEAWKLTQGQLLGVGAEFLFGGSVDSTVTSHLQG